MNSMGEQIKSSEGSPKSSDIDLPDPDSTPRPSIGDARPALAFHPSDSSLEAQQSEAKWPRSWRAYTCLFACFLLMFNSWGLVNAYGTFSSFYSDESLAHVDQIQLNIIGSTQSALVLLFSSLVGRLLDANHSGAVVRTGAFLVPFGMFMLSIAHPSSGGVSANYATIWVTQGLVVGLGMACFFVSSSQSRSLSHTPSKLLIVLVAATWFPNRKGLAVGFVACGASIAGVVYPSMTRYLINSMGFNNAVRMVATLVAVTAIFSVIFARPNPAHRHRKPPKWLALETWIDMDALHNKTFRYFTIAVAFLFFGFYPVFFNLEEVSGLHQHPL